MRLPERPTWFPPQVVLFDGFWVLRLKPAASLHVSTPVLFQTMVTLNVCPGSTTAGIVSDTKRAPSVGGLPRPIVMVKSACNVCEPASVSLAVNVKSPVLPGLPQMYPSVVMTRPSGRLPPTKDQAYGMRPPL